MLKERKEENVCYKYMADYFENTTLHGLKYVGDPNISFGERTCWLLCVIFAALAAAYFMSIIYIAFDKNPILISVNAIPTPVSAIPFPTITVCSLNKVTRSAAKAIRQNGTNLEKNILSNYCAKTSHVNTSTEVDPESSYWSNVLKFILKASQPCTEMIKLCKWRSKEISCEKWFNPILTDEGLCCTFNQMPNSYIFKYEDNFNELSYNYPQLVEDWTQETGYRKNSPIDAFPWRPAGFTSFIFVWQKIGAGLNLGLTLVLDGALHEYYCSSAISAGFKILMHNPLETAAMEDFGRISSVGRESWLEIEPSVTEAVSSLRSISVKKRHCYFNSEKDLKFFRLYTQRNCKIECRTNYTLKLCGCVPYFLPRDATNKICRFQDYNCTTNAEMIMQVQEVDKNAECYCLPGCFDLSFEKNGHYGRLHSSVTVSKHLLAGMPMDYFVSGSLDANKTAVLIMARSSGGGDREMDGADVENLEDARKLVRDLRQKMRAQAQQLIAWRRAYKMQETLASRLQREKADQLKVLSSKLLLFESRLIRKQKDISALLNHRENIIHRQQRIIETLTNRLIDNGLEPPHNDLTELDTNLLDLDSLNDSDSAVVMEDVDSDSNVTHIPRFRSTNSDGVTVMRSISDAIDPNLKYTSARRSNGFLRRPEILETVYSVEEDADSENQTSEYKIDANRRRDAFASQRSERAIYTNEETNEDKTENKNRLSETKEPVNDCTYVRNRDDTLEETEKVNTGPSQVTTYNRVMSNHRSVTKPKDVKYKRINKAKSKSLEELRGRLKNWVEQGSKLTGLTLEHSQSYA